MKSKLTVPGHQKTRRDLFASIPKGLCGAEIGVFKGQFSRYIADMAEVKLLYMVDSWYPLQGEYHGPYSTPEAQYWNMRAALVSLRHVIATGRARPIVCNTDKAVTFVSNDSLDFIYIDADHSEEGCFGDLQAWIPKVKSGGMISGHDINRQEHGVTEAVNRHMEILGLSKDRLHVTDEDYPSFWFIKD